MMCRSKCRGLAAGIEHIRRFASSIEERYPLATTVAAMQNLLKHDTNAQINYSIQQDMLTYMQVGAIDRCLLHIQRYGAS